MTAEHRSPIGDFCCKFSHQFFLLAMTTKMVAGWSAGGQIFIWLKDIYLQSRVTLRVNPASYPDVSLDVCTKEGGKETTGETHFACHLYPSHGPLRFITSHSFRAHLCHAKNEAPEEEAGVNQYLSVNLKSMAIQYFPGLVQP